MGFIASRIVNGLSLWVLDLLFTNIHFVNYQAIIVTALALVIVNAIIKPVLELLSLPLTILTFGLFSFVVNALVLMLAFNMSSGSSIDGFSTAFLASIVLSIINPLIAKLFTKEF
ncbi:MAG: phage holin family protein [Peptoniphilaceae bacterium]|nr:phage holin family protein [Peptoniphilaceae bacterium]MDY6018316.1 phage holin family protein [Anaerococcus sp.]